MAEFMYRWVIGGIVLKSASLFWWSLDGCMDQKRN